MADGESFYDKVVGSSTEGKKSPFNRAAPRSPFNSNASAVVPKQAAPANEPSKSPFTASKSPFTAPKTAAEPSKSPFASKSENASRSPFSTPKAPTAETVSDPKSDESNTSAPKRTFSVLGISIETPLTEKKPDDISNQEVPNEEVPVVNEPAIEVPVVEAPVAKSPVVPQVEKPKAEAAKVETTEETPRRPGKKKEVNTMNVPDSGMLNVDAAPTVAAQAFLRAQEENHETPSIATAPVPPVIEKKIDNSFNPFKPLKKPIESEKPIEEEKPQTPPKTAEEYFLPMRQKKAEPINPFKPTAKAPVKRAASASVNRIEAEKEEAEAMARAEAAKASERMSIYKALGTTEEVHTTFKVTEFKDPEEVVPFTPFKSNNDEE